jgi:hypothetical protein
VNAATGSPGTSALPPIILDDNYRFVNDGNDPINRTYSVNETVSYIDTISPPSDIPIRLMRNTVITFNPPVYLSDGTVSTSATPASYILTNFAVSQYTFNYAFEEDISFSQPGQTVYDP